MWRMHDLLDLYDLYDDMFMFGGGGAHPRAFGASVSKRATEACERAKALFLEFLATADTSAGDVTEEIVHFHLVGDMQKAFGKFVPEHGCRPKSRKLTREEQNKVNKQRQSLIVYTSVTVGGVCAQASEGGRGRAGETRRCEALPRLGRARPPPPPRPTASGARAPLATKKRNMQEAGLAEAGGSGPKKTKTK